jgi:hypothetical protein
MLIRYDRYGVAHEKPIKLFGASNTMEPPSKIQKETELQKNFEELLLPCLRHLLEMRPEINGWDIFLDFIQRLSSVLKLFCPLLQEHTPLLDQLLHSFAYPATDILQTNFSNRGASETQEVSRTFASLVSSLGEVFSSSPAHLRSYLQRLASWSDSPVVLLGLAGCSALAVPAADYKTRDLLCEQAAKSAAACLQRLKPLKKAAFEGVLQTAHKQVISDLIAHEASVGLLAQLAAKAYTMLTEKVDLPQQDKALLEVVLNAAGVFATGFDDSVRERVKFMKNFFHLYSKTLPSMRDTRKALALARFSVAVRKWQTASSLTKQKETIAIEE